MYSCVGPPLHLYYTWRCFQRVVYSNACGRGYVVIVEALRGRSLFDRFDDAAIHCVGVVLVIRCLLSEGGHEWLLILVGVSGLGCGTAWGRAAPPPAA